MKQVFAIFLVAFFVLPVQADGLESLEIFVRTVSSGRADFIQVVTSPEREGQGLRRKTSSGTFEFFRPNRFRFVYKKPFAQSIVADGQTLWLYDVDLGQVSARQQSQVMGATPAALIATAPDLRAVRAEFRFECRTGRGWLAMGAGYAEVKRRSIAGRACRISCG